MGIKKYFSAEYLLQMFRDTCKRFPISVGLAFLLFITTFCAVCEVDWSEQMWFFLFFYTVTGCVLNISLSIWGEGCPKKPLKALVICVVNILWLAYCIYAAFDFPYNHKEWLSMPGLCAFSVAVLLSVYCLPFFRSKSDSPFWNFATNFTGVTLGSIVAAGVLASGISLLYAAVIVIFNLGEVIKPIIVIDSFLLCLVMPLLIMGQIPPKEQIYNDTNIGLNKFFRGVIKFMFIPLLAMYLLVLYLYGLKSLITFELPNGWVSTLVSVSMFFMVLIYMVLYISDSYKEDKLSGFFVKYIPWIMIPLVLFMSVGVFRRFNDYGITIPRLYLLIVNIWFLAICVYFAVAKRKRMILIPASFSVLFVVFSFGPLSAANITLKSLRTSVTDWLAKENAQLPLTDTAFENLVNQSADSIRAFEIGSKLAYITHNYPEEKYSDIVDDRVSEYRLRNPELPRVDNSMMCNGIDISGYYYLYNLPIEHNLDAHYTKFYYVSPTSYYTDEEMLQPIIKHSFTPIGTNTRFTFEVSRDTLMERSRKFADYITLKNDSALYFLREYSLDIKHDNCRLSTEGYLFVK